MKKKLLLSILGLAAASAFGQGTIRLDNYNTYGPPVTYGPGTGGTVGQGLHYSTGGPWTMGVYYAVGDVTGSVAADPSGVADPTTLGGGLALGTGFGSTGPIGMWQDGYGYGAGAFGVPGTSSSGGDLVTLVLVAYNGADYLSSTGRGHSTAFTMTTAASGSPVPPRVGDFMSGFSVFQVPEPPTIVFLFLGGGAALSFCRRRA